MVKGSQLSQLKSALAQAGITGQSNGKKRKRSVPAEKDKEKRAAKLQDIHQKLNPFDVKVTKLKHDIGGRRLKGVTGKPAQSKQHGIEQRKQTLLKEYEEKDRAGGIVDRRFGENDPAMSIEERMLERFTKERQRSSRGAAFNLEDEDELTHYGQSLSKLDDFDNIGLEPDSEEENSTGQIGREVVSRTHFGGFDDDDDDANEQPARKKSKAEVMAEVMAKSKEHKLRRQMERVQEDDMRHQLDNDFSALRDLIFAPDPSSTGSNSVPLGRPRSTVQSDPAEKIGAPDLAPEKQDDDYDQHVRELAFDKRSKPKNRTKTEEELALEEKEALEKAERNRRKRMLGLDESDSEDDSKRQGKRKRGGDDLDDEIVDEDQTESNGLGAGLGEAVPMSEEDEESGEGDWAGSGEEVDGEAESQDGDDVESDDSSDGSESEREHEDRLVPTTKQTEADLSKTTSKVKELPYTFPCPANHEEFLDIVKDVDDYDVPVVIQRIRALYHTSLAPDNKLKLQTLATILVDHILYITSLPVPRYTLLSSLLPHLIILTHAYPVPVAQYFNEKLQLMYKNLKRGLSRGPLDQESKTWPGIPELSLLRIIGVLWPTSDMNHAVVSPTRVLMGAYLGLSRVRSLADISSGLFLCSLFLQFESLSKRLVPEAVNFLISAVIHLAPHQYKDVSSFPGSFPSPDFNSDHCTSLVLKPHNKKVSGVQKANLTALLQVKEPSEEAKVDLLGLIFELLGRFAEMYKSLDGFIELYTPIADVLKAIHADQLIDDLQTRLTKLCDIIGRLIKFSHQSRQPLLLQAHKPIPIPTYVPKFETTKSNYLRHQDPDHERNEASKLRKQYKQEKKGAIRELRKDARFLAGVEQQKQIAKDRAYNERMKRVFGSIEGERAEEKAMEREKAKDKRRSGRK